MDWGRTHWVGLVINLLCASIEIYDSYTPFAPSDADVDQHMEPLLVTLPWVLKRYLKDKFSGTISTAPYAMDTYEEFIGNPEVANG
ncbi:unnamed protein product [Microthlaspi erraticum]|uniref:Ubiquitin-like protease family profile domain-containing protein n=1 Tax=Microthlaspi erraticum TaxID=1685480 RepID=A0A6D2IGR3_9BRAS|nr:unnamed protein product [Microthlaspi erraticum]